MTETVPYGPAPDQVGDLRLPPGAGPFPVAVLLHGGFWRERWRRDTIDPLAVELTRRGFATWNLEYRRVGPRGGGWPATAQDVAGGIDELVRLAGEHSLDLRRVVLIGHSAGGQLALWAVRRLGLERAPRVRPVLVVSLAGITDVERSATLALGDEPNATAAFMGGLPDERPDAYAAASPLRGLPLAVRQLVVQGGRDDIAELVDFSRSYSAAAAAAGDRVELLELPEADHFDVIDPASEAWQAIVERIERIVAGQD